MWRLLRTNRRFRRLFLSEAVTSFGETAVYLSLAIWVKDLTGSDAAAGLVFLVITVPGLAAPLLGHVVDRVRRRLLLLRMYLCMAVLVLMLLAVRGPGQVWIIYLVTLGYGVFSATPVRPALLKDVLPSADAAAARSLIITVREGVRIVSPALGAGIYALFGGNALAVLGAGTFLVAVLLLASIDITESDPEPAGEPFRTSVVAGFRFIRRVPLLLRLALVTITFMAVIGLLETAVFAANDKGLGQQAAFLGVITSLQGGGSVLGGILAGRIVQRSGEMRASSAGYALMAVGLLLCLFREVPLFLAGVVFFGLGLPFVVVSLGTALHLYTPSRMQGRVNAAFGSVTEAAQAMSIAAGAALIGVIDYRVMYLVMAGTAVVCAVSNLAARPPVPEVATSVADTDGPAAAPADAPERKPVPAAGPGTGTGAGTGTGTGPENRAGDGAS
ncbi:MFS transporter [Streptomyces aidingensis]|uniref:Predicted arabinose efflux permease, MFS family n=1 Tax=Streptomyces aidingensis TaxID=910347 RepID=A0A1I1T3E7_9ACTN|nr:MFS transporter [Streptomyces aidingensis]SFD53176.1 Predicted arabinose efflux permease, MFS family [Streptomyces aidingensis]